jgi:hypothetical protein
MRGREKNRDPGVHRFAAGIEKARACGASRRSARTGCRSLTQQRIE